MTDKPKVLVTGATGFVGSAVVHLLRENGFVVGEISRHLRSGTRRWPIDLTNASSIGGRVGELFDIVVHCAGLAHQFGAVDPNQFHSVNVDGAANAVKLAVECGARRYILISSVAVYGNHGAQVVDESFDCCAADPYALSKLAGEQVVTEKCRREGISLVILRPATVIGSGDRGNTARLISLIGRRRFVRFGSFENKKTLIVRQDLARAVQTVIEANETGTFNVAAPPLSMAEIVGAISRAANVKLPGITVPDSLIAVLTKTATLTFWPHAVRQLGHSLVKFLSDDRFAADKFDRVFGKFAYSDVGAELARQTAAQLGARQDD